MAEWPHRLLPWQPDPPPIIRDPASVTKTYKNYVPEMYRPRTYRHNKPSIEWWNAKLLNFRTQVFLAIFNGGNRNTKMQAIAYWLKILMQFFVIFQIIPSTKLRTSRFFAVCWCEQKARASLGPLFRSAVFAFFEKKTLNSHASTWK